MTALILDMGLPQRTAKDLRSAGWDVVHVAAVGMGSEPDEAIVQSARSQARVIVTLDEDFARIVATSGNTAPSVILIRLQRLNRSRATELIPQVVTAIRDDLAGGCIATVTANGIRVRPLPVRDS